MSEKQSRVDSAMETVVSTAVGFVVSWVGWMVAGPLLFGIETTVAASLGVVSFFTILSLLRQFVIRRLFNGRSVWWTIKNKWHEVTG